MRYQKVFDRILAGTDPIEVDTHPNPTDVRIVNMIASVHLLPPGETLSLLDIFIKAKGAVKYTPGTFQALALRFGDNGLAGKTTALVHPNGKLNIVGAVNHEHARQAAQHYRLFIEAAEGGNRRRMLFENFKVYNTVIASELGFRPNLSKLQRKFPLASEWRPELFPGLLLQVWLSKKSLCTCVKKKNKSSDTCKCNSMCLVFDTGRLVVTGIHDYRDATKVCDCVRLFFTEHQDFMDTTKELPRHLRWTHRNAQKLAELEVDFIGTYKAAASESASTVLKKAATISSSKGPKRPKIVSTDLAPIFQACDAGQVEMVQFLISLDQSATNLVDDEGQTPLQRLFARKDAYQSANDLAAWNSMVSLLGGSQ